MISKRTSAPKARLTSLTGTASCRQPSRALDDPGTWPIVWRVVAPCTISYDHDMVLIETEDEQQARAGLLRLRRAGYAVRLQQVRCGPLPQEAEASLAQLRRRSPQNSGAEMREVLGHGEAQP